MQAHCMGVGNWPMNPLHPMINGASGHSTIIYTKLCCSLLLLRYWHAIILKSYRLVLLLLFYRNGEDFSFKWVLFFIVVVDFIKLGCWIRLTDETASCSKDSSHRIILSFRFMVYIDRYRVDSFCFLTNLRNRAGQVFDYLLVLTTSS